jgi:hypothetical protein
MGWPELTGDDRTNCLDLVRRALDVAQGDPDVLAQCGFTLAVPGHDYDRGLRILSNVVEDNPNHQLALIFAGISELHVGSLENCIAYSKRAVMMSPGTRARSGR